MIQEADSVVPHKMEDVKANDIHIGFQVPQYALMTAGEVMFSITGLEFSYSQVPGGLLPPASPITLHTLKYQWRTAVLCRCCETRVVMFSVGSSVLQAPANMKSVLQAGWLLTVAFGNVIVLIVAEGAGLEQVWQHKD